MVAAHRQTVVWDEPSVGPGAAGDDFVDVERFPTLDLGDERGGLALMVVAVEDVGADLGAGGEVAAPFAGDRVDRGAGELGDATLEGGASHNT